MHIREFVMKRLRIMIINAYEAGYYDAKGEVPEPYLGAMYWNGAANELCKEHDKTRKFLND